MHVIAEPGSRALILQHGGLSLGTVESGVYGPFVRVVGYGAVGAEAGPIALADMAPDGEPVRPWADRPADAMLAVFDAALEPYAFGMQRYDPFESLGSSLERLSMRKRDAGQSAPDQPGEAGSAIVKAVWAAMESDLFRFAYDGGFTADLELVRGGADWFRFARLNDLYRALIKAIVPFGMAPRSWTSWLRDPDASLPEPRGASAILERLLTRGIDAMHGAIVARAEPGSIFVCR